MPKRQSKTKKTDKMDIIQFETLLHKYWKEKQLTPMKHPKIDGKDLDLFLLYKSVCNQGGAIIVSQFKNWKDISNSLNVSKTCTSSSHIIKKHYQKYLMGFEMKYFHKKPDEEVPFLKPGKVNLKYELDQEKQLSQMKLEAQDDNEEEDEEQEHVYRNPFEYVEMEKKQNNDNDSEKSSDNSLLNVQQSQSLQQQQQQNNSNNKILYEDSETNEIMSDEEEEEQEEEEEEEEEQKSQILSENKLQNIKQQQYQNYDQKLNQQDDQDDIEEEEIYDNHGSETKEVNMKILGKQNGSKDIQRVQNMLKFQKNTNLLSTIKQQADEEVKKILSHQNVEQQQVTFQEQLENLKKDINQNQGFLINNNQTQAQEKLQEQKHFLTNFSNNILLKQNNTINNQNEINNNSSSKLPQKSSGKIISKYKSIEENLRIQNIQQLPKKCQIHNQQNVLSYHQSNEFSCKFKGMYTCALCFQEIFKSCDQQKCNLIDKQQIESDIKQEKKNEQKIVLQLKQLYESLVESQDKVKMLQKIEEGFEQIVEIKDKNQLTIVDQSDQLQTFQEKNNELSSNSSDTDSSKNIENQNEELDLQNIVNPNKSINNNNNNNNNDSSVDMNINNNEIEQEDQIKNIENLNKISQDNNNSTLIPENMVSQMSKNNSISSIKNEKNSQQLANNTNLGINQKQQKQKQISQKQQPGPNFKLLQEYYFFLAPLNSVQQQKSQILLNIIDQTIINDYLIRKQMQGIHYNERRCQFSEYNSITRHFGFTSLPENKIKEKLKAMVHHLENDRPSLLGESTLENQKFVVFSIYFHHQYYKQTLEKINPNLRPKWFKGLSQKQHIMYEHYNSVLEKYMSFAQKYKSDFDQIFEQINSIYKYQFAEIPDDQEGQKIISASNNKYDQINEYQKYKLQRKFKKEKPISLHQQKLEFQKLGSSIIDTQQEGKLFQQNLQEKISQLKNNNNNNINNTLQLENENNNQQALTSFFNLNQIKTDLQQNKHPQKQHQYKQEQQNENSISNSALDVKNILKKEQE